MTAAENLCWLSLQVSKGRLATEHEKLGSVSERVRHLRAHNVRSEFITWRESKKLTKIKARKKGRENAAKERKPRIEKNFPWREQDRAVAWPTYPDRKVMIYQDERQETQEPLKSTLLRKELLLGQGLVNHARCWGVPLGACKGLARGSGFA